MNIRTPPLLLGAALLLWGWHSGYLLVGAILGLILEAARVVKTRWDFSNDDFNRIWTFCTLLFLASTVYAFTANDGPTEYRGFFQNPSPWTQRTAGAASARTAATLIKWLPMTFFLFMAAQIYSTRSGVPLETISLILRRRWKKALREGKPLPPSRSLDVSYVYLALTLFGASMHTAEDTAYFWGLALMLAWALWPLRSPRFGLAVWIAALAAALLIGYSGQRGLARLRAYVETLNPQWLGGFGRKSFDPTHNRTALGRVGKLKMSGQIVLRLEVTEGAAPTLLREACYRAFRNQVWYSDISRSSFANLTPETNTTTWILVPGKSTSASVRIANYLSGGRGLLPLPSGSGRLDNLPAFILQRNDLGAVLAEGPGLVIFDARHSPGASLDTDPDFRFDLDVSTQESNAVHRVVAQLGLRDKPAREVLPEITRFFAENFTYSLSQEPKGRSTNDTPLTHFLLNDRRGHCEYFATATVLMLRHLGIPARYAVGYAVHEGAGRDYVVRERDGHAWCRVWDDTSRTWQDFDTTPASWLAEENKQASPLQFLSDVWSRLRFELAKFRWGQTNWRRYLLWGISPVLVILLIQIIFRRGRARPEAGHGADLSQTWPGLDSEFYQLEARLARRGGVARHPGEPLAVWLLRAIHDPGLASFRQPLQRLLVMHYRYRFDPEGLPAEERAQLRAEALTCLQSLERA